MCMVLTGIFCWYNFIFRFYVYSFGNSCCPFKASACFGLAVEYQLPILKCKTLSVVWHCFRSCFLYWKLGQHVVCSNCGMVWRVLYSPSSFFWNWYFSFQIRASRYITGINRTSELKVIVVWICYELWFLIMSV